MSKQSPRRESAQQHTSHYIRDGFRNVGQHAVADPLAMPDRSSRPALTVF